MESKGEAVELITLHNYFYLAYKWRKIFSSNFRQFCWDMDIIKTIRKEDNWAFETLCKAIQINSLKNWQKFSVFH